MASLSGFSVRRREPVLVPPAEPTPQEFKPLSDIDDQSGVRFEMPVMFFYSSDQRRATHDPAKVIREAIAQALVFYYPFAGRVREGPGGKLSVDCTGEGVMFVEADANVRLDELADEMPPPVWMTQELIHEMEGSGGVIDCPIFLFQVTRLACGGWVLALRLNHTMCDAAGLVHFLNAVGDMARGASTPSIPPVWARELVAARRPPRITHAHLEYEQMSEGDAMAWPFSPDDDMVHETFFFGPKQISALRNHLPPHLRRSSEFELIAACIWRSRTIALQYNSDDQVRIICVVNARNKYRPPLPAGYYGNALAFAVAVSEGGDLCSRPLGHAVQLVKKAKDGVTDEYMRSVADLMVLRGRPPFVTAGAYLVSDVTRSGLEEIDLGWGPAVYGGPGKGGDVGVPGFGSFFVRLKKRDGEEGTVVAVSLPRLAMGRFVVEMRSMTTREAGVGEVGREGTSVFDGYGLSKL